MIESSDTVLVSETAESTAVDASAAAAYDPPSEPAASAAPDTAIGETEDASEHSSAPKVRAGQEHAPDLTARLYVGLWLPAAGALLTYALMAGNYWVAFVGVELLLVGWFGLGKL